MIFQSFVSQGVPIEPNEAFPGFDEIVADSLNWQMEIETEQDKLTLTPFIPSQEILVKYRAHGEAVFNEVKMNLNEITVEVLQAKGEQLKIQVRAIELQGQEQALVFLE